MPENGSETEYRHVSTGELGYYRAGSDRIRVEREDGRTVYRTFLEHQWVLQDDKRMRPINRAQLAQVCFAADRELCKVLGLQEVARGPDWSQMRDNDRARLIESGPRGVDPKKVRRRLYVAMRVVLDGLIDG